MAIFLKINLKDFKNSYLCTPFLGALVRLNNMVGIAQLVRASDCDSEGRGVEPHYLPHQKASLPEAFFNLLGQ